MTAALEKAFGYQGDNMNLPVRDVVSALPFYETVLGFRVVSQSDTPHKSAVLARDQVRMRLAENGGDPAQDGCAFHVKDLAALFAEFQAMDSATGLVSERLEMAPEQARGPVRTEFGRSTHFPRPDQFVDRAECSTVCEHRTVYLCSDDVSFARSSQRFVQKCAMSSRRFAERCAAPKRHSARKPARRELPLAGTSTSWPGASATTSASSRKDSSRSTRRSNGCASQADEFSVGRSM